MLSQGAGSFLPATSHQPPIIPPPAILDTGNLAINPPATQPPKHISKTFFLRWPNSVASHKPPKDLGEGGPLEIVLFFLLLCGKKAKFPDFE